MGKYTCEKCGKEFKQKGHYTTHVNKKKPCLHDSKINEINDKAILESEVVQNTKNVKVVREEGLDKFYTIQSCSKKCIDKVFELYQQLDFDLIVEDQFNNNIIDKIIVA